MRREYQEVIAGLHLFENLDRFDPIVIGTPPLGLAIESSDIDVACSSPDLETFRACAIDLFSWHSNFHVYETRLQNERSIVVQFQVFDWDVELFCQPIPTAQQWGVRHFLVEKRLLELKPELAEADLIHKRNGVKTEPAFARALHLPGDPYVAILELERLTDGQMVDLIASAQADI